MKKVSQKKVAVNAQVLQAIANARTIRNPIIGRSRELFYLIDAATMRAIRAAINNA